MKIEQMKILCAGDSITKGRLGSSYVQLLQKAYPHWCIVNKGADGLPLCTIGHRLLTTLQSDASFDVIVLQTGYNDMLLPSFAARNVFFQNALRWCIRKGHVPIESAQLFGKALEALIKNVQAICKAKIILTTIACLGENLSSDLNMQRRQYNEAIRKAAVHYGCAVADTSILFYEHISTQSMPDYLLPSFLNTVFFDPFISYLPGGVHTLSRYRGLKLTIDGCHLNKWGAALFKSEVERMLLEISTHRPEAHQEMSVFVSEQYQK